VLETSLGRVDLGVEAQMKEVERGFDALMQEQGQ
jgi:flagellar biosynthesis/type III secretory pathway protein FliH